MKKFWFLALAIPLAFLSAPQAQADPCPTSSTFATLETIGSCTIGDKTFSGFDFASSDITAAQINASTINDGTNFGFLFQMTFTATPGEAKDFLLQYNVAVTDGSARIVDVFNRQNSTTEGIAFATVGETICLGGPVAGCPVENLRFLDTTDSNPAAEIQFDPVSFVGIEKDVTVAAAPCSPNGTAPAQECVLSFASLSGIENTVSQTVPEPATLLLLGSGLVGVATWSRKKFRK